MRVQVRNNHPAYYPDWGAVFKRYKQMSGERLEDCETAQDMNTQTHIYMHIHIHKHAHIPTYTHTNAFCLTHTFVTLKSEPGGKRYSNLFCERGEEWNESFPFHKFFRNSNLIPQILRKWRWHITFHFLGFYGMLGIADSGNLQK